MIYHKVVGVWDGHCAALVDSNPSAQKTIYMMQSALSNGGGEPTGNGARLTAGSCRDAEMGCTRSGLIVLWLLPVGGQARTQSLGDRVDAYFRGRGGVPFSGVVVVARGDTTLLERGWGHADADLAVPNTPALRFNIGSVTKPITATAVLRLVEQGRVQLDGAICRYLAGCPAAWNGVTVRQVLSHTSGIPDLFGDLPAAPADSLDAVVDSALIRHRNTPLQWPSGTRYSYSNFNYILLGYLLETAGGDRWEAVLRREVFQPAAMRSTEYDDVWQVMPGRARGYEARGGQLRHVRYRDHAAYTAGGLLSTAGDLLRFDRALSGGRLLPDSLFRMMGTPGLGEYGLGWQIIRVFGRTLRNHTGGVTGFASHLARFDDGTIIIVLSNVEDEPVKATACDIAAIVFGLKLSDRTAGQTACRTGA
jgi:CubicO group peptidase (beta-lactamase class C family)